MAQKDRQPHAGVRLSRDLVCAAKQAEHQASIHRLRVRFEQRSRHETLREVGVKRERAVDAGDCFPKDLGPARADIVKVPEQQAVQGQERRPLALQSDGPLHEPNRLTECGRCEPQVELASAKERWSCA